MSESTAPVVVWFQVPTVDNATRAPHPAALWDKLEESLIGRFGGLTRGPNVKGAWRDPSGKVIREPSRTYEVDVPEARLPEARSVLAGACAAFGQECLRVTIEGRAFYLSPDASQVAPSGLAL